MFLILFLTNYRPSKIPKSSFPFQTDTETSQTISLVTAMRPDFFFMLFFLSAGINACWRADVRPVTRAGLHHRLCNFPAKRGRGRLHPRGFFSVLDSNMAAARCCTVSPGSTATASLVTALSHEPLRNALINMLVYHLVLPQRGGKAPSFHLP